MNVLPEPWVCQISPRFFVGIGAPFDDRVDSAALVLTEDRLLRLAVLDVEEHPLLQRAQELARLEERLHRERGKPRRSCAST